MQEAKRLQPRAVEQDAEPKETRPLRHGRTDPGRAAASVGKQDSPAPSRGSGPRGTGGPAALPWTPAEEEEQIVDEDEEETIESEEAPRVYRLTHAQWEHSVQALLNLEESTGLSSGFIGTTMNGGYDNNTETLLVDAILFQDYQRVAIELSDQVARDPELLAAVAPDLSADSVETWLEAIVSEAWRRPISSDELSSWSNVFALGPELVGSGDDLADGVQVVLQALLQSPMR